MGELNKNEQEGLIKELVDIAEDFISEGTVIENFGSHGYLPPRDC